MTRRLWDRPLLAALTLLSIGSAEAQTLPQASGDLTLPPELRGNAPQRPLPARHGAAKVSHRAAAAVDPTSRDAPPVARSAPEHPVDLGVTVRGGSSTSRIYSPTGTSQAVQESGSAVGAGMRFGF